MQGDEAELINKDHSEIVININPGLTGRREEGAIEEYCQECTRMLRNPNCTRMIFRLYVYSTDTFCGALSN